MITFEEMPDDNADLARIDISFPRLPSDSPLECPVTIEDILRYLALESPDREAVKASSLTFLRTALVKDYKYWIWRFVESDGAECYVTVSLSPKGRISIGYEENYWGLSPEQYILGDYYNVF